MRSPTNTAQVKSKEKTGGSVKASTTKLPINGPFNIEVKLDLDSNKSTYAAQRQGRQLKKTECIEKVKQILNREIEIVASAYYRSTWK